MNIAVFGGAFDPPHVGHFQVVSYLDQQSFFDEIWLVPTKHHAFSKHLTADHHRVAMLQAYCTDKVKIDTFELSQSGTSYTYKTLKHFAETYPQHTFSFVIGSDNVTQFHTWDKHDELLEHFPVVVYPRENYPITQLPHGMKKLQDAPTIAVSSTQIKEKLSRGESIAGLVLPSVLSYIQQHELYQAAARKS